MQLPVPDTRIDGHYFRAPTGTAAVDSRTSAGSAAHERANSRDIGRPEGAASSGISMIMRNLTQPYRHQLGRPNSARSHQRAQRGELATPRARCSFRTGSYRLSVRGGVCTGLRHLPVSRLARPTRRRRPERPSHPCPPRGILCRFARPCRPVLLLNSPRVAGAPHGSRGAGCSASLPWRSCPA